MKLKIAAVLLLVMACLFGTNQTFAQVHHPIHHHHHVIHHHHPVHHHHVMHH